MGKLPAKYKNLEGPMELASIKHTFIRKVRIKCINFYEMKVS